MLRPTLLTSLSVILFFAGESFATANSNPQFQEIRADRLEISFFCSHLYQGEVLDNVKCRVSGYYLYLSTAKGEKYFSHTNIVKNDGISIVRDPHKTVVAKISKADKEAISREISDLEKTGKPGYSNLDLRPYFSAKIKMLHSKYKKTTIYKTQAGCNKSYLYNYKCWPSSISKIVEEVHTLRIHKDGKFFQFTPDFH